MIRYEREYKRLYEVAFLFEQLQPWGLFKSNEFLAIKDPQHETMLYCSIQKDEQQLLFISVYKEDDLKTYQHYLTKDNYSVLEPQYFKHLNGRTALTVSFKEKKYLQESQRELINQLGYRFKRKTTWPIFMKLEAYKLPIVLEQQADLEILAVVLERLIDLSQKRVLNQASYSTQLDQNLLYYDYHMVSEWQLITCENPLKNMKKQEVLYLNDIMIHKLKKLPTKPIVLEIIHFLLTEPMQEEGKTPVYPLVFGVVEQQSGEVIFADLVNEEKDYQQAILNEIANLLVKDLKCRPLKLMSHDDDLIELFTHFCEKTEIKLVKGEVEIAQKFMEHVLTKTIEKEDDYLVSDDEVDLILDTTSQICEVITKSSCFCQSLSPKDKDQFKYTIELLHIMMISQFQELPECWTPENFDYVINKMFPKVFPEERLPIVTEMVREYILITGEANVMPNYKTFLGKLNQPLALI